MLNRKGLERALTTTTNEIHVAYPVTETFAQRNQNTTVEEAAQAAEDIIKRHRPEGHGDGQRRVRLPVRGPRRSRAS